ncbi:MAG: septum formation initiator family protein, partial [Gemmatimonadales bacterium]
MNKGRVIALAAVLGGFTFGAFGGEYRLIDWWQLKRQVHEEDSALVALRHEIDSLAAYAEALEHDSATQERVAREKFGMLRDGEIVYLVESR